MSEVTVNKRHISLPWAVAVSAVVGIISGTGVYYSLKGDVDRNYSYSVNLEATSRERFQQVERRIERLEETSHSSWTLFLLVPSLPKIIGSRNADVLMSDSIAKHADQHLQVSPNIISLALEAAQPAL